MAKTVYCIYACNTWKDRSSMRLCTVCTTLKHVRRIILAGIKNEVFSFDHNDGDSFKTQAKHFRDAFDKSIMDSDKDQALRVLAQVNYAYVEEVAINENPFL